MRVAAFNDSSLNSVEAIETSIAEYKASFINKPKEELKEFKSEMRNDSGGFDVAGFMNVNGATYQFLEHGVFSKNGRVLIMRGAVDTTETSLTQEEFDALIKITKRIMDGFNAE